MKTILIYKKDNILKFLSQVTTKEGFNVSYSPVYIYNYIEDSFEDITNSMFEAFELSKRTIDLGDFPTNKEDYKKYVTNILTELNEKSFNSLQKNFNEFILKLDESDNKIILTPLLYKPTGSEPDINNISSISTISKNKENITKEILNLIDDYCFRHHHR